MMAVRPLMIRLIYCAWIALLAESNAAGANAAAFYFPATGVSVDDQAVLLAIDDVSLPLKHNVCYYLSKPKVRKQPVLTPSRDDPAAPDHLAAHFYGSVLHDEGKFRMWYYPVSFGKDFTDLTQGPVCYAESDDGLQWTKPNLRQIEFKGSKDHNGIKLPEKVIEGVHVIKDEDDPDPARRYKMVYNPHNGRTFTIQTATSADGIHWRRPAAYPKDQFLEQSGFFKFNGMYLVHGQGLEAGEGGGARGRQGYAWVSYDFDNWITATAETFTLAEPVETARRGTTQPYDQVHLGVAGTNLGNVVVGLYGLWHNYPGDRSRNVPESWFGHEKTSCDLGLVVSNDGIHFREPVKGHVYISRVDSAVTAVDGKTYPTILIQSSEAVNVGDETRIYHGRWRNAAYGRDYWGEVALATLPRDRWGALGLYPNRSDGEVWSTVVRLPQAGCQMILNADAAGSMRVEIADERFRPLPGFCGSDCGTTEATDGLECPVTWRGGGLTTLGGRRIRLRIRMERQEDREPRLYGVYLRATVSE
jgi:hypothetical protein